MTRPKVTEANRKRVANACDACKRKKSKCNGQTPCPPCLAKSEPCVYHYDRRSHNPFDGRPSKRRCLGEYCFPIRNVLLMPKEPLLVTPTISPPECGPSRGPGHSVYTGLLPPPHGLVPGPFQRLLPPLGPRLWPQQQPPPRQHTPPVQLPPLLPESRPPWLPPQVLLTGRVPRAGPSQAFLVRSEREEALRFEALARNSGPTPPHERTRILQAGDREVFIFIGPSATLSSLCLVRDWVSVIDGDHSAFVQDRQRFHLLETERIDFPPGEVVNTVFPSRDMTNQLIESYLETTSGLMELFCLGTFYEQVEQCYHGVAGAFEKCRLFLVLAVGIVVSRDDAFIMDKHSRVTLAEKFYQRADQLRTTAGHDHDAPAAQIYALRSFYMLCVSRRHDAWIFHKRAVDCAVSVGCHEPDNPKGVFSINPHSRKRFNEQRELWRSLYVMDKFLASLLGLPSAIIDEDCHPHHLSAAGRAEGDPIVFRPANSAYPGEGGPTPPPRMPEARPSGGGLPNADQNPARTPCCPCPAPVPDAGPGRLDDTVRIARTMSNVLEQMYTGAVPYSTRTGRKLFSALSGPGPHMSENWGTMTRTEAMARLNVALLHNFSIILLTRPFFFYLFAGYCKKIYHGRCRRGRRGYLVEATRSVMATSSVAGKATHELAQACIEASNAAVTLIHRAYECRLIPRRNPFVICLLFTGALIILANELTSVVENPTYGASVSRILALLSFCAATDPQAERLLYITNKLKDVIDRRARAAAREGDRKPVLPRKVPGAAPLKINSKISHSIPDGGADCRTEPGPSEPTRPLTSHLPFAEDRSSTRNLPSIKGLASAENLPFAQGLPRAAPLLSVEDPSSDYPSSRNFYASSIEPGEKPRKRPVDDHPHMGADLARFSLAPVKFSPSLPSFLDDWCDPARITPDSPCSEDFSFPQSTIQPWDRKMCEDQYY